MFETEKQKRAIERWCRLAIQLNGAADSGRFEHLTTSVVVSALERGEGFQLLERELPTTVWDICKLSDVDRHELTRDWQVFARAYDPQQFHVSSNGLALLVAFVLHMIATRHAAIPT